MALQDPTRKRRLTGEVQWVKVPCDEGVAIRVGPESCGGGSNAMAEALTGVRAGQVLSREILFTFRVPTLWDDTEGNTGLHWAPVELRTERLPLPDTHGFSRRSIP